MVREALVCASLVFNSVPAMGQCPDGTPPPCGPLRAPGPRSVAVLYFDNLSPDTTEAYLAEGLTVSLIDRLAAAGLPVASRFQVRRYRQIEALNPADVSRALGVSALLTGSVRRVGGRIRIWVELVSAPRGTRMWSRQFDRPAEDLLDIESAIAATIADSIAIRLLPAQRDALRRSPTLSPAAYEHLLRGNYLMNAVSVRNQEGAIAAYEAAIRLDPDARAPRARLAQAWALCAERSLACRRVPRDSAIALGERLAREAIRIDSTSAEAWIAFAVFLYSASPPRPQAALQAARRAVALDPGSPVALQKLGSLLSMVDEDAAAEAEATMRRAIELDPTLSNAWTGLAGLAMSRRRLEEARLLADSAVATGSENALAHSNRAMLRAYLGDTAGTRQDAADYTRLLGRPPIYAQAFLLLARAAAGDTLGAAPVFDDLVNRLTRDPSWAAAGPVLSHIPSWIFARLGRFEAAVRALPEPSYMSWRVSRYPHFDPIRTDPGFQRWVESARAVWAEP